MPDYTNKHYTYDGDAPKCGRVCLWNGNGTEVVFLAYLDCVHERLVSINSIVFIGNTPLLGALAY